MYCILEEREFMRMLQRELEKVNDFFRTRENFFAQQLNHLEAQTRALSQALLRRQLSSGQGDTYRKLLGKSAKDLYHGLSLLQNYRVLNYTAFVKILKKHDKLSAWTQSTSVFLPIISSAYFFASSEISRIIKQTENLFVAEFGEGDRRKAMNQLRVITTPLSGWVPFGMGISIGFSVALLGALIKYVIENPGAGVQPNFFAAFPVFRFWALILLFLWLWGMDVYLYRIYRMNWVFIFEADPRNALKYQQILQVAALFTLLFMGTLFVFVLVSSYQPRAAGWIPLSSSLLVFLIVLCPFDIFYRPTRRFLLHALKNTVIAPFTAVPFRDFFFADQLTSMVRIFQDAVYFGCFYTTLDFLIENPSRCVGVARVGQWIVSFLPFYWRFMQSLRRFVDLRNSIHLWNALKYFSAILVTLFNLLAFQTGSWSLTVVWVVFASISTLYSFCWDVYVDWGLFRRFSGPNRFLRDTILFHSPWVYYFGMISNLVLRIAWAITISPQTFGLTFPQPFFLLAISSLEIYRRCQWNIFRLENEHLSNVEQYRVVNTVPLLLDEQQFASSSLPQIPEHPLEPHDQHRDVQHDEHDEDSD